MMNECATDASNSCEDICIDTESSYICDCSDNTEELQDDGFTCEGKSDNI